MCPEALVKSSEPRTDSPLRGKPVQPSPSTVFQAKLPILVSLSRPLDLISLTIAPRVSTWAVRARGEPEDLPAQVATSAPLRVWLTCKPGKPARACSRRGLA